MIISRVVPPSPEQTDITTINTRNSWWDGDTNERNKSDSELIYADVAILGHVPVLHRMGPSDLALLTRLAIAGGDHGKFMRTLPIQIEAQVTSSLLRQLYTYRAGIAIVGGEPFEPTDITINSTSVMHTAGRRPFVASDMDMSGIRPDIADQLVVLMNAQRDYWIETGKKKPSEVWRGLVNLIPSGWIYTIHLSFNYAVARAFYHSRRNHRLRDDWGVLCQSLTELPNSQIITTARGE